MKYRSLLLALLFSALFFSITNSYADEGDDTKPDANKTFTYADFEKLVKAKKFLSIDVLLWALPKNYLANYTFMYQSRSLQAAFTTPNTPRAIVFGDDAKLIMTFTEGSKNKAGDALEVMSWDDSKSVFTLHEVHKDQSGHVVMGEENPSKCVACHGNLENPGSAGPSGTQGALGLVRPIWEPYRTWPGAYGSLSKGEYDRIGQGTPESAFYHEFINQYRDHGRYAVLPKEILRGQTDDYENDYVSNGAVNDPNALLNKYISYLNGLRGGALLSKNKNFPFYEDSLKAIEAGCFTEASDIDGFFPKNIKDRHVSFADTLKDTYASIHARQVERRDTVLKNNTIAAIPIESYSDLFKDGVFFTATFRYIVELMGIDFSDLRTAFDHDSYEVLALLDTRYNESYWRMIENALKTDAYEGDGSSCEDLRRLSVAKLSVE